MFPIGYQNPTGFKMKRMIKVKTSSGQQDRNIKKLIDSYRNSKTVQNNKENKENRQNFPKQLKRSSDYSEGAQIKMLKYGNYNKENILKEHQSFKSLYKNTSKMIGQNAYQLQYLGQSQINQRPKIQRQVMSTTDRNATQSYLNSINNVTALKLAKNLSKNSDISIQSKNMSNISEKKEGRYLNLSTRRMQKIKSYNSTKLKTQRESLVQHKKRVFYQVSSIKGSKQYNQDSVKAGEGVWIVCDGHGQNGHNVSWYVVNVLYEILQQRRSKEKVSKSMLSQIFIQAEKHLEQSGIQIDLSGSTCVMVVAEVDRLFCACIGDSVAIAISDNQSYTTISSEHKPCNPEQAKRIQFFGGIIKKTFGKEHLPGSPLRMWGQGVDHWGPGLAISRSFGDKMGQKYGLIYEPEIKEIEIGKDLRYIVLGSDGLFDQVAPTEMANILNIQSQQQQKFEGCRILTEIAQSRWMGYSDDISAIVIYL